MSISLVRNDRIIFLERRSGMGQETRHFNNGCVFGSESGTNVGKRKREIKKKLDTCMEAIIISAEIKYGMAYANELRKKYLSGK